MTLLIENQYLQLGFTPETQTFQVLGQMNGVEVRHARFGLRYSQSKQMKRGWTSWAGVELFPANLTNSGPAAVVEFPADPRGIRGRVTFWLPEYANHLTWQAEVINEGVAPVWVDRIEMLQAGFTSLEEVRAGKRLAGGGFFRKGHAPAFFSNGWTSWDDTRTYTPMDRFVRSRLGMITMPMRQNPGTPHPRRTGLFSSDLFGVLGDQEEGVGLLVGFLSQREHFGSLETYVCPNESALSIWANGDGSRLDPGATMRTDRAYLAFIDTKGRDPLGSYFEAVGQEHALGALHPGAERPTPRTGWCSWYHYYQGISQENIERNIQAAIARQDSVPLELIQVDDGFQTQVGDWLEFKETFPNGLTPLVSKVREAGMMPGVWLAPFTVDVRSRIHREHPEWLLKDKRGRLSTGGYNWGRLHHALDLTHPEAQDYVRRVIDTAVHEWGFEYLKLDFLYSGAIAGVRKDLTLTRAQSLQRAFSMIRETAGQDTILLGCGCPLGAGIGIFDMMRIGPDVSSDWYPRQLGLQRPFRNEPGLPSIRGAVHNILIRAPMHRRWWVNDGDCLLVRPETNLSLAEVQMLASALALTGGPLLVSDDLAALPPERLKIVRQLLPLGEEFDRPWVIDWFDQAAPQRIRLDLAGAAGTWHVLALLNWKDSPQELPLDLEKFRLDPEKLYVGRSFWTGEVRSGFAGRENSWSKPMSIPAHGCLLMAVREATGKEAVYLGSDLHFSQGLEVEEWDDCPNGTLDHFQKTGEDQGTLHQVKMGLWGVGECEGVVDLWLPRAKTVEAVGGSGIVRVIHGNAGVWRFEVKFDSKMAVRIFWKEREDE